MIKVFFVCLGNICRSPMAELYFKKLTAERGYSDEFYIDSFGTCDGERGNPVYPPAKAELSRRGVSGSHIAKPLTASDAESADYILVSDGGNIARVLSITGGRFKDKIHRICDFTYDPRDVADPWYTRDFSKAFDDIKDGCDAFLDKLERDGEL